MTDKPNPFASADARDTAVEAAIEDVAEEAKAAKDGDETKASEGSEKDEGGEDETAEDPFAEAAQEDEDDADGEEEGSEEEDGDDAKTKKTKGQRVPISRLNKEIEKKKAEMERADAAEAKVAKAEEKLAAFQAYETLVEGRYQGNVNLAKFDHDVMAAAERLAKAGDEEVADVFKRIVGEAKSPHKPVEKSEEKAAPAAVEVPKAIQRATKKAAQEIVDATLKAGQITGAFETVISRHIIENTPLDDLVDLDQEGVVEATRAYLKANGLTLKQVRGDSKVSSKTKSVGDKPPSGGRRKAPTSSPSGDEGGEKPSSDAPKAPKSEAEWKAQRQKRLEQTAREIGL